MELWETPYPASRQPVLAPHGMVATSQPLAAQAGLAMLQAGGNAVDAAIATAIALTVLEPTSNGIGGDAFAIVTRGDWDQTIPVDRSESPSIPGAGHNGSGRSPLALTSDLLRARTGGTTVPNHGWLPVTVPGAPALWRDLHRGWGRLPFADLFGPAIAYARDGFPVSPLTARGWARTAEIYASLDPDITASWAASFLCEGVAPTAGSIWRCPDQARTLEILANSQCDDFYTGDLAAQLIAYSQTGGGLLSREDLEQHRTDQHWPLTLTTQDKPFWAVTELPPNTQGVVAMNALCMLATQGHLVQDPDDPMSWHAGIEAIKFAFVGCHEMIADPGADIPGTPRPSFFAEGIRAPLPDRASDPRGIRARPGGTVYLCAADEDGCMVSFIQSNYMGFGSGLVVPGTGIALQNRGACFDPDPCHPNGVGPGKRPYHTIIPGFLTGPDRVSSGPFGIMGGHMQPQAHIQFVWRIMHGWHVQAALDAPRWRWDEGKTVAVEATTPQQIIDFLRERGHDVRIEPFGGGFGRGQAIFRLPQGGYIGGSDSRGDGCAVGY